MGDFGEFMGFLRGDPMSMQMRDRWSDNRFGDYRFPNRSIYDKRNNVRPGDPWPGQWSGFMSGDPMSFDMRDRWSEGFGKPRGGLNPWARR